jgi:nucleotide-binding universal stress UspA family protein
MNNRMKILIGYDGSEWANAALEDLKTAGLPKTAEALVMSMADVFIPLTINEPLDDTLPMYVPEGIKRAHKHAEQKLHEAEKLATRASEQLKGMFPEWQVNHLALADSPAWGMLRQADEWKPDLIVVGAQGHTVLGGRLILGSISQRVLYEATCSVRIARTRNIDKNSLRLLIAVDNSSYSRAAVDAVCKREWPKGTEARLLSVVDTVMVITSEPLEPLMRDWIEVDDEKNWEEVRRIFVPEIGKLNAAGLNATVVISDGNPTDEILQEADTWGADCIFLGPKGTRGIARLLLGSVSSAVSARAQCSVEVVRWKDPA